MLNTSVLKKANHHLSTDQNTEGSIISYDKGQKSETDGKRIHIISCDADVYPVSVEALAVRMLKMNNVISDILCQLRSNLAQKKSEFRICLADKTLEEQTDVVALFADMYGVIGAFQYNEYTHILTGRCSISSKAINFLNGRYLEIAIAKLTDDILKPLANRLNKTYRLFRNVKVTDGFEYNEFDLLIQFDDVDFIVEVKSGKTYRDYDKYYELGVRYGVVPDKILLVNSQLSSEQANLIEYFCEYYASSLLDYSEKLEKMIVKSMEVQRYEYGKMECSRNIQICNR